ncbi:hypothetical protein M153_1597500032 [Pseudoloma neurophilia]|uniref:Uncharacterized protein n=1 Tax=Pseudoloma neurophilia TaxID=146866 RepID=A0A0R0LY53_9MICR|nr:hypothetical protein M153_1597500032 [Pseudoloma neurophilia]
MQSIFKNLILFFYINIIFSDGSTTFGFKTIKSATDPSLFITSFQKIFRLRKTFDPLTGLESNVVKFEEFGTGYKIIVNDEPMCLASEENTKIVSCNVIPEQPITKWSIDETPKGVKIRAGENFCLNRGKEDNRESLDGFELTIDKCDTPFLDLWIIRPIEALVSNSNTIEKAREQDNNGRQSSITDFIDHNPRSNITTSWEPVDKQTTNLVENINGFY